MNEPARPATRALSAGLRALAQDQSGKPTDQHSERQQSEYQHLEPFVVAAYGVPPLQRSSH